MDLSSPRFDRAAELIAWPGDLTVLMIGVAARQGGSRTALVQSDLPVSACAAIGVRAADRDPCLFAPLDGAFNGIVAASLVRWNLDPCRRRPGHRGEE